MCEELSEDDISVCEELSEDDISVCEQLSEDDISVCEETAGVRGMLLAGTGGTGQVTTLLV